MKQTKIAIIGAGAVGSTTAYALMLRNVAAEIHLVDVNETRCKGEVFDLSDVLSFSETSKIQTSSLEHVRDSDIIILAAGLPQKSGQSRRELINTNKKIALDIVSGLKPLNTDSIIIVVTNPVDAITYFVHHALSLPAGHIFGTGTFLDSQRVRGEIAKKIAIAEESIHAYILGEHGDSQIAAWSSAHIAGVPLLKFPGITQKDLDAFAQATRTKVYDIIQCKGATFFGITACVAALCEDIVFDQKRIAPVSVFNEKLGVCLSLPAVIGRNGAEKIMPIPLNDMEQQGLLESVQSLKKTIELAG
jgi:L-lactate dehydrogenase